jgi:hypothetical protein
VGARCGPATAVAAGGVAGEEGSQLAKKRRLCLTCELGEVLGVSAGDEKLGKKGSSLKRRPWRWLWQWQCARGGNSTLIRAARPVMTTA